MKIAIIIEARMTSSRLPGKHMLKVKNKNIFEILIEQLSFCRLNTETILATTVNKEDDCLSKLALGLGLSVYRGNEDNVYERVLGAALTNEVDIIVEVTADCPLIDPNIIDEAISIYLDNEFEYVSNGVVRVYPDGMDIQVYSTELLRASEADILNKEWLEHVTIQFRNKSGREKYRTFDMKAPVFGNRSDIEITLDEHSDWKLIEAVYSNLKQPGLPILCSEIVSFLDKSPTLKDLLQNVERKSIEY